MFISIVLPPSVVATFLYVFQDIIRAYFLTPFVAYIPNNMTESPLC